MVLSLAPSAGADDQAPLAAFVNEAVAANAAVLAAEANLQAHAERQAGAARSYDNPELSIESEEIGAFGGVPDGERRLVVGVTRRFDIHGKRRARVTVAQAKRLVAQAQLEDARAATAGELLKALAGWQTASARGRLLATHLKAMEDFEALAERRRAAGDISAMEAGLATLALAETRMRRAAAEAERSVAAQGVRGLTFADDARGWPMLGVEFPPLTDTPMDAVAALPAVRAAMLAARAASASVDEERRDRRPDPTLSIGVGREAGAGLAEIGLSVPLVVLDRGTHAVSAASADATAAARRADDVARQAKVRFEGCAERYRTARRAWRQWLSDGADSLADREMLARRSWEVGELAPQDYLTHVEAAIELRLSALDLRRAAWDAWFDWLQASGGIHGWLGAADNDGGGR